MIEQIVATVFWVLLLHQPQGHLYSYPFATRSMCEQSRQALSIYALKDNPGAQVSPCLRVVIGESEWLP